MSGPIDEKAVRYGDVFEWDDGSRHMFIAWSLTGIDYPKKDGRPWRALRLTPYEELPDLPHRGFKTKNRRTDKYAWSRVDVG